MSLSLEECRDTIICAAAGGINYWAKSIYTTNTAIQFVEEETGRSFTISLAHIEVAADRIVHERLARNDIISSIAIGDIDAEAADVIIQVAAFGEIVYG